MLPERLQPFNDTPIKVLDKGSVQLIDVLGDDMAIVNAARVSYGAGTQRVSEDRHLIRYLMRHRHTSPFEMCEIVLRVQVPMDTWRQWIRHRTACLAEGTEVYFDLPGGTKRRGNQLYKIKIEDIWEKFQPTQNTSRADRQKNPYFKRDRVKGMKLRQVNENTLVIQRTQVVDVFKNGVKPVFRLTLTDGKTIDATADHQFMFADGWMTLKTGIGLEERNGLAVYDQGDHFLYVNGASADISARYQDRDWLDHQYNVEGLKITDIADDCGVSYHTIRKWLRHHRIQHIKGGRSQTSWNKGKTYILGPRKVTEKWRENNRLARSGAASNFWEGGISSDRDSIGRWTTQIAGKILRQNGWTCQLCHKRANELHCHHVVPVWADDDMARVEANLTTLCGDCHRNLHGKELDYIEQLGGPPVKTEWVKKPRIAWNKLTVAKLVRIQEVRFLGHKMTYDLEVKGPHHNFIANGIVTHNSVNEYSTRYSEAIDAAQRAEAWRAQATDNKQGSSGLVGTWTADFCPRPHEEAPNGAWHEEDYHTSPGAYLSEREQELLDHAREVYDERLRFGVAREQARKDLPLSTYTSAYWKCDLHNLLHFLSLRMDTHAQKEIRDYANAIAQIVKAWVPWTWKAFEDYRLDGMVLSRMEVEGLRHMLRSIPYEETTFDQWSDALLPASALQGAGFLPEVLMSYPEAKAVVGGVKNREAQEFLVKLKRLLEGAGHG